jgi:transposase-like protein
MNIEGRSRLLEDLHRPKDRAGMAAEIRRLYTTGLKPRDISSALRIDVNAVLHALCGEVETA